MAVHGDEAAAPRTLGKYAHNSYIQVCGVCVCVCEKGSRVIAYAGVYSDGG